MGKGAANQWTHWFRIFIYSTAGFIICLVSFQEFSSPDLHWHIKQGLNLLEQGLSPFIDHFSFTFPGQKINQSPWLFDLIIGFLYKYFGYFWGVGLYRFICSASAVILINRICRRKSVSIFVEGACVFAFINCVLWLREPRPELITFPLCFYLYLLLFDLSQARMSRTYIKLFALLIIWSNIHPSAVMGFTVLAALLSQKIYELYKNNWPKADRIHFYILLFAFFSGYLNPQFRHPFTYQIFQQITGKQANWGAYIIEFIPRPITVLPVSILSFFVLLLIPLGYGIWRRRFDFVLIVSVMFWQTLKFVRMFPHLIVLSIPLLVHAANDVMSSLGAKHARLSQLLYAAILIVFCFNLIGAVKNSVLGRQTAFISASDSELYSEETMANIKKLNLKGKMLNDMPVGGFLLFHLWPDVKIAIDGRINILYPFHFLEYHKLAGENMVAFKAFMEEYDFDYIYSSNTALFGNFIYLGLASGKYKIKYQDKGITLLSREESPLRASAVAYVNPDCIYKSDIPQIDREINWLESHFHPQAPLPVFLKILRDIYLEKKPVEIGYNAFHGAAAIIRLLGFTAIKSGNYKVADRLLLGIDFLLSRYDRLLIAKGLCQLNNCLGSENYLNYFPADEITQKELVDVYNLLKEIEGKSGLMVIHRDRVEKLAKRASRLINSGKPLQSFDQCKFLRASHGLAPKQIR